jgi:hypothetical protein
MYSGYGDRQRNLQVDLDLVLSIEVKKSPVDSDLCRRFLLFESPNISIFFAF